MDNHSFISMEDLEELFSQLNEVPEGKKELTEEEIASQKRYEEIIKKHKNN